jgi:hypothetical protein
MNDALNTNPKGALTMTTTTQTDTPTTIATIGNGSVYHPVKEDRRFGEMFTCGCPGTRNASKRIAHRTLGFPTCTHSTKA